MKDKIVKYVTIIFMLCFFIAMTIIGLKNCDKPTTDHSHFHVTKPEDRHKYVIQEKLPPHVKRENIILEVFE